MKINIVKIPFPPFSEIWSRTALEKEWTYTLGEYEWTIKGWGTAGISISFDIRRNYLIKSQDISIKYLHSCSMEENEQYMSVQYADEIRKLQAIFEQDVRRYFSQYIVDTIH